MSCAVRYAYESQLAELEESFVAVQRVVSVLTLPKNGDIPKFNECLREMLFSARWLSAAHLTSEALNTYRILDTPPGLRDVSLLTEKVYELLGAIDDLEARESELKFHKVCCVNCRNDFLSA